MIEKIPKTVTAESIQEDLEKTKKMNEFFNNEWFFMKEKYEAKKDQLENLLNMIQNNELQDGELKELNKKYDAVLIDKKIAWNEMFYKLKDFHKDGLIGDPEEELKKRLSSK